MSFLAWRTRLLLLALAAVVFPLAIASAAGPEPRCFEMRIYTASPGKLDDLHARFRNHTMRLFERHGMTNIGYWVPTANPESKLVYVLAYPSKAGREESWKGFQADPDWQQAKAASEVQGKLVAGVEQRFMQATDFSPEVQPGVSTSRRVFELRTYTTTPNNLPLLHARFRDHTMTLFAKHGMTNLWYWHVAPGQKGKDADNTLVYLLAHKSQDAAKASFDAFRQDPDWLAARKASEAKAGGSLTEAKGGVVSEFLVPTDYSPLK